MNTRVVWRPLHRTPEYQLALDLTGHEIGHINQIGDVWVACYAGRRTKCLSEVEAKAWVEEQAQHYVEPEPEPGSMRPVWLWLTLCVAFALMALAVGCAASDPLPHYPCWDKKAQKHYECSDQEWMHQIIMKELP